MAHGTYPVELIELEPQFVEALPKDLFDRKPIHYKRVNDDSFELYSVGWNMKDEGSIPAKKEWGQEEGDWVW
tara:strand:- start:1055 stop:1270 length:216 start_codon:yes stop_codon:yes gene_type:complete